MNEAEPKTTNNREQVDARPDRWKSGQTEAVGWLASADDLSLRSFRNEAEIHAINRALEHTGWNRKRAAKLLSISYRSLLYKIRQHNIGPAVEHN